MFGNFFFSFGKTYFWKNTLKKKRKKMFLQKLTFWEKWFLANIYFGKKEKDFFFTKHMTTIFFSKKSKKKKKKLGENVLSAKICFKTKKIVKTNFQQTKMQAGKLFFFKNVFF